jgi:hypothetical protein
LTWTSGAVRVGVNEYSPSAVIAVPGAIFVMVSICFGVNYCNFVAFVNSGCGVYAPGPPLMGSPLSSSHAGSPVVVA